MPDDPAFNERYAELARTLADCLMRFARDRSPEDRTNISWAQSQLCRLRREELEEEPIAEG